MNIPPLISSGSQKISYLRHRSALCDPLPSSIKGSGETSCQKALFHLLIEKGVIDREGNVLGEYRHYPLPALNHEEIQVIKGEIERVFSLNLGEDITPDLSMDELFRSFISRISKCEDFSIGSIHLIGGYVSYLLVSKTSYITRVFNDLHISELDDAFFRSNIEKAPADIDIRWHIQKHSMNKYDIQLLRDEVLMELAEKYMEIQLREGGEYVPEGIAYERIYSSVFSELCTIEAESHLMQLISLKGSCVDWILYHDIPRLFVFTLDDLYIPIDSLFSDVYNASISPQSHRQQPLESLLHSILGLIIAKDASSIDEKGWYRYVSLVAKGKRVNRQLEQILYKKADLNWIEGTKQWIEKHYLDDIEGGIVFVLNICLHLETRISADELDAILTYFIKGKHVSDEVLGFVQVLLFEKNTPFSSIASTLKVGGYLPYTHNDFVECIENLKALSFAEQQDLAILFFLISPLKISPESNDLVRSLFYEDQVFIRYIGLLLSFSCSDFPSNIQNTLIQRSLLSLFDLLPSKKMELKLMFESFIGKDSIPKLKERDFEKKWIETLFEWGRESEEIGFLALKELPQDTRFFFLVKKLIHYQPDYALRVFNYMNTPHREKEAFKSFLECGQILTKLKNTTPLHDAFVNYMIEQLPQFLNHRKSQNQHLISKGLFGYVNYLNSIEVARIGLENKCFIGQIKKTCQQMVRLDRVDDLIAKLPDTFSELEELLKMMSKAEAKHILPLYEINPDYADCDIFSHLIQGHTTNITDQEAIVRIIYRMYQKNTIHDFQQIETTLLDYSNAITDELKKNIYTLCYLERLTIPQSIQSEWSTILLNWCQEPEPNYELIERLYCSGRDKNFLQDSNYQKVSLELARHTHNITYLLDALAYFPENKNSFYLILNELITSQEIKLIELLDKIALIDPNPPTDLLETALTTFIERMCSKRGSAERLAFWFNSTLFLKKKSETEQYKQWCDLIFKQLIVYSANKQKKWIKNLYLFIEKNIDCLIEYVDWSLWDFIFNIFIGKDYSYSLQFFQVMNKYEHIQNSPVFFQYYASILKALYKSGNTEIFIFLRNIDQHIKLCSQADDASDALTAHYCLLDAASRFVVENREEKSLIVDNIRLINQATEKIVGKRSEYLNALIDFRYISLLFLFECPEEASDRLSRILSEIHSNQYWQTAGILINTLVILSNSCFLDEIDRLLDILDVVYIPNIKVYPLVKLLLNYPSIEHVERASSLLQQALSKGDLQPNLETWILFYETMVQLMHLNNDLEITKLTIYINLNIELFAETIGDDIFYPKAVGIFLKIWMRCKDPYYAPMCEDAITDAINLVFCCRTISNTAKEQLLEAIPYTIIGLANLDGDLFSKKTKHFMDSFKKRDKKTFTRKAHFIHLMIEALEVNHPNLHLLMEEIGELLSRIKSEFQTRAFTKEIHALNELFIIKSVGILRDSSVQPPSD